MVDDTWRSSIIDRRDYITDSDWESLQEFIKWKNPPFLVLSKKKAEENYKLLDSLSKGAKIYYAVKACPHKEIVSSFVKLGSCFDIASIYELDHVLSLWATPDRVSYWNTIKKEKDIKYAYDKWVRMFATDSYEDLEKISRVAPWSKVYFRLLTPAFWADWPLSRKFGCELPLAFDLALKSKELGLIPYWISFHVWSQQNDIIAWDSALSKARDLFDRLKNEGITLWMLNLGGWLPSTYIKKTKSLSDYLDTINTYLDKYFWEDDLEIIMEPWRSIVWDIWVIVSEVTLVSKKSNNENETRWVYLDIWKFGWLIETLDESIKYPIYTEKSWELSPVILAWPTCDSADILYEDYKYLLPESLISGDMVYIFSTWAYTQSYSAVEFNWFPPLQVHII